MAVVASVATVATAAMVIVVSLLASIVLPKGNGSLLCYYVTNLEMVKSLPENLFASQNREALCSTALENMTT